MYLRTSKRDCGTNSLKLCPRVAVLALRTLKKVDASISTIPKIILYTYIIDTNGKNGN